MFVADKLFSQAISLLPLVSIDLVIRNQAGDCLLGHRKNAPARDFWFVPGGRVRKNETLQEAFSRIINNEIGLSDDSSNARFLGVFEHFYNDSVFEENISTHYVVLGFEICRDIGLSDLPNAQHSNFQWFTEEAILERDDVHINTKNYFVGRSIV